MVSVSIRRLGSVIHHLYYASAPEVSHATSNLSSSEILLVHQTSELPPRWTSRSCLVSGQPFRTSQIDLEQSEELLFAGMRRKACRYPIRASQKLGARLRVEANTRKAEDDFLAVHNAFAARKKHSRPMGASELGRWRPHCDVFVISLDGKPVCGHLLIRDRALMKVGLLRSASVRLEGSEAARVSGNLNRYLHWHEMRAYKSEGFRTYDFGGVGDHNPEVAKIASFKLSFGGRVVTEWTYVFAGPLGRVRLRCGSVARALLRIWKRATPAVSDVAVRETEVHDFQLADNG